MKSLSELWDRLGRGNDVVAEEAYRAYEPYLRRVVRRLLPNRLRPKFDSLDVVQSVWGDVLTRFRRGDMQFQSSAQLRAFLVRATHNRFIDHVRQTRAASQNERSLSVAMPDESPASQQPRASQLAQAQELWTRLLAACPAQHHAILRLRRDGFSLEEIARRVGLHEGSVRRILRDLAVKFAGESASLRPRSAAVCQEVVP